MSKRPASSYPGHSYGGALVKRKGILFYVMCIAACCSGYAQELSSDLSKEKWFDQVIGIDHSGIINGREYKVDLLGRSSNPFFEADDGTAKVVYDNHAYEIPVLYDVYKDAIVLRHLTSAGRMWLIEPDKSLINEFVIAGHVFRNIDNQFYEVIFEGEKLLFVAKRTKVQQLIKGAIEYIPYDTYFIIQSSKRKQVKSKRDLVNILRTEDDRKQLRIFIREEHIRVRRFRTEELRKILVFINNVSNNNAE